MKNINLLEQLVSLIVDNCALILSTIVSLVSILNIFYQTRFNAKAKMREKYIDMRLNAYIKLLDAISEYNENPDNINVLISSCHKAMMLSHPVCSEAISNFCCVLEDYHHCFQNNKLTQELELEFIEARRCLEITLNETMRVADPFKYKRFDKILKKDRKKPHRKANKHNNRQ